MLHEYTQKKKLKKPSYNLRGSPETSSAKARVVITDLEGRTRIFAPSEGFRDNMDAKNHAAMHALHALLGNTNVHRSLAPKFHAVWHSLSAQAKEEAERAERQAAAERAAAARREEREADRARRERVEDQLPSVYISESNQAMIEAVVAESVQGLWRQDAQLVLVGDSKEDGNENDIGDDDDDGATRNDAGTNEEPVDAQEPGAAQAAGSSVVPRACMQSLRSVGFLIEDILAAGAATGSSDREQLLTWLVLHVPETRLPYAYAPKRGIQLHRPTGGASGQAGADDSANVDLAFRERMLARGLPEPVVMAALAPYGLAASHFETVVLHNALMSFWREGLAEALRTGADLLCGDPLPEPVWSLECPASPAELLAARTDEAVALEAILSSSRFVEHSADRWSLRLGQADDTLGVLELRFPEGSCYPYEMPVLLYHNNDLSPGALGHVHLVLGVRACAMLGSPMAFDLSLWLADALETLLARATFAAEDAKHVATPAARAKAAATAAAATAAAATAGPAGAAASPTAAAAAAAAVRGSAAPGAAASSDVVSRTHELASSPWTSWPFSKAASAAVKADFERKSKSVHYRKMLATRSELPTFKVARDIISLVGRSPVVVISGETGCGKTTQVPQLLLDECIRRGEGGTTRIICTQPRRLAAIGVAQRVADERGETVGETVGYHIRMETKYSSATRLLFVTTGILLRYLQGNNDLDGVSHIIIDEVHERSIQSDFLLIIVRELLVRRPALRLVLMSATLNAELFSSYFSGAPSLAIPGRTFPVEVVYLQEIIEATGYTIRKSDRVRVPKNAPGDPGAPLPRFAKAASASTADFIAAAPGEDGEPDASEVEALIADYNQDEVNYDLLHRLVCHIDETQEPGAVLVFMPGMQEIRTLVDALRVRGGASLVVYPLHSSLAPREQQDVFKRAPAGKRKVVISTNIAETSLTIDDVVYVVDAGKVKETQYEAVSMMQMLVTAWVSRAAADQRKGRAGRVRPGVCYRLYSRSVFEKKFAAQAVPEIHRSPLENTCLQIKVLGLPGSIGDVLARAIEPPPAEGVAAAVSLLKAIRALDESEQPTALGLHLSSLPLDVVVGKTLIYGAMFGCLDPVLTIAASLGERSPFVCPFDSRDAANAAHRQFAGSQSDLLGLWRAFSIWSTVRTREGNGAARAWCQTNFVSEQTLHAISATRIKLRGLLRDMGFIGAGAGAANAHADNMRLVRAIICAGLYPRVAKVVLPPKTFTEVSSGAIANETVDAKQIKLLTQTERVFIHPASLLFGNSASWATNVAFLAYFEKLKTTRVFLRDATVVTPYALLLFGGRLRVHHDAGRIYIDDWLVVRSPAKLSVLFSVLRTEMDRLLAIKVQSPRTDLSKSPAIRGIIELLSSES